MPSNSISQDSISQESRLFPSEPMHPQGPAFFAQLSEILDGQPKDEAIVEAALEGYDELLEKVASDLYRIGSMLTGEGEETIGLIEQAVATADIPSCSDHFEARHSGRMALAAGAIELLDRRNPGSLAAPGTESGPASCIEDDDLSAAGVTHHELEQMLSGPDRDRLRGWLEGLSSPLRIIFVLRAVAGLTSTEVAALLAGHGGASARTWTPDSVRTSFRQALCSLASQLLHASAEL
jgi:hypothetical protein